MNTNIKQRLHVLLNQEMDRKNFLRYMAAAGLMAMGGGFIVQSLGGVEKLLASDVNGKRLADTPISGFGYGTSVYGGRTQ